MAGQSLLTKLVTTLGQIALAWFLVPEEFGLVALAYLFSVVPVLIQQGGLKEVLIRRRRRIELWARPAFWLGMLLGLAGGVLMLGMLPLARLLDDDPRLPGLLAVLALQFPIGAFGMIPQAMIESKMRFRLAAVLAGGQAVAQTTMMVVFAGVLDWGPYSLVVPRPLALLAVAIVGWIIVRPRIGWRLHVRRWRYLLVDGTLVLLAAACDLLTSYGGYLVLRLFEETAVVGLYYWAFMLSQQTLVLVALRLRSVLFPVLSSLQADARRQAAAFLRALKVMACVVIPACCLQVALSDPGVRAVFEPKWFAAIPLLQILSASMILRGLGWPAVAMLQAQGRFGTRFLLALMALIVLIVTATLGAWKLGAAGVALAVSAQLVVVEPLNLYMAVRPTGHGIRDLVAALARPALLGALSIGPGFALSLLIPEGVSARPWLQCGTIVAVAALLYFPLFKWLVPDAWSEAVQRVRGVIGR